MSVKRRFVPGACCALVVAVVLAGVVRWHTNDSHPAAAATVDNSAASKSLLYPNLDACAMQPTMAMGVIAQMAGGASLSLPGYQVGPLLTSQPGGTQPSPGTAALVMVSASSDLGHAQSAFAAAKASSTVAGAGIVYLHSTDPALRSCHYDLADKPAAAELAATAGSAMVAMGLVTKDALSAPSSTWAVTDDPLDPAVKIVTLGVQGKPDVRPALGAPSNIFQTQFINAFVNRTTGDVIAAGYAAW